MRTRESMKRKRINVALILHGPGTSQPMVQWRFLFILSFVILVSSPCSDSRVCTRKILSFKWSIVKDQDRSIIRPFQCHNCTEWHTGNGSVAHFARSRCNQREAKESTGEKTRKNNSFGSCMRNLCWCNFECAARNPSSIQKIAKTLKSNKDEISANYIDDGWQGGNLLGSQDQESWGSVSMQKKNIHTQELPFVNITHNGTEDYQLVVHNEETLSHKRIKRGVIHLYNMLVCATGCNPLSYKGYGCYCGFLGSGYVIDGIDRCCKMHDWCYDATDCPMFSEYFVPYYWRCYHGYKPVCAVEHGNWGGSGSCAQRLCECDRSFAECLKRYPCPTTKAVCTSSPWRLVQNLFMTM